MYGKNIPQDYFDNTYDGCIDDEQDAYDFNFWTIIDDIGLDI